MWETIKNDPILKTAAIIILSVLGFGLAFNIMFGSGGGMGHGGGMGGSMMGGAVNASGLTGLLAVLIKILLVVSIAGLVTGLIMYLYKTYGAGLTEKLSTVTVASKNTVNCSSCGAHVSGDFKFCPHCGGSVKTLCSSCGTELKKEWKCCPVCGSDTGTSPGEAAPKGTAPGKPL